MQEPNRREDKIQGGEIRIRPTLKREREHGKLYRWFDNFWYHHKWKTVVCLFFAITILVCSLQMCNREESGDITVLLAGPYGFTAEQAQAQKIALENCLSTYLPADYDGNGQRHTDVINYTVYSTEQIEALKNKDPENPITINTVTNAQEYSSYNTYTMTGATSILFLDPWLFEQMASKGDQGGEYLIEIPSTYNTQAPQGAVYYTNKKGESLCLGVRLGETALYKNNIALQVLPEDTVLCLMTHLATGKTNEEDYQKALDYFAVLAGVR